MLDTTDTIVALASARQGGPRGVVRISGPRAVEVVSQFATEPLTTPSGAAVLEADLVLDAATTTGRRLPATLLVWPGERSYTRQPTVEIHTIGSIPLLERLVHLATSQGCRLATPGEFTLRAYLAGRIDLTQAEAVLGVIDAAGTEQFEVALAQLAGGMSRPLAALREELLMVVAELEAGLDFAEEDLEFISPEVASHRIGEVARQLQELEEQLQSRGHLNELPRVVLVGRPNVGKSSLFNALVARYQADASQPSTAAIVSPIPGATRDYLTARLAVEGIEFELIDTAGEEAETWLEPIETAAQQMTRSAKSQAALHLVCRQLALLGEEAEPMGQAMLVATRCDEAAQGLLPVGAIATSSVTGEGIDRLAGAIAERLEQLSAAGGMVPATAGRCEGSLRGASEAVREAHKLAQEGHSHELVVHELRHALDQLGQVAGVVATDDILDRVFSQFCIGK